MQLVELQRNVHAPQGDKVAVFAVSYDPVETLQAFAAQHGIEYPLLADVGSQVIAELGLLNTDIVAERAFWGKPVEERHLGLPFPGTFVLDESGIIVDRFFERSHRIRPGGNLLLSRMGIESDRDDAVMAEGPALTALAWVDTREYFPNQLINLTVRIGIEPGYHAYVPPNPAGFTNLTLEMAAPPGVFVHDYELPRGHSFSIDGFEEEFTVVDGEFDIRIPFYILEDSGGVSLPVTIGYQACNATTCLVPDRVELELDLVEIRA